MTAGVKGAPSWNSSSFGGTGTVSDIKSAALPQHPSLCRDIEKSQSSWLPTGR